MYDFHLLVPCGCRVAKAVCLFEDVLKNFHGTQALFLSPSVSHLATTWYKMFAEGAHRTM